MSERKMTAEDRLVQLVESLEAQCVIVGRTCGSDQHAEINKSEAEALITAYTAPLTAEVERLRAIVELAYHEGWADGRGLHFVGTPPTNEKRLHDWNVSQAKKAALDEKGKEGV